MRDYAKTQPQVHSSSTAARARWRRPTSTPAPNFFRFNIDGAQMHMGLGDYIYDVKHFKKIATVGEDYCVRLHAGIRPGAGLLPARRPDHQAYLGAARRRGLQLRPSAALPDDVDAIYLGLGGADAIELSQPVPAGRR